MPTRPSSGPRGAGQIITRLVPDKLNSVDIVTHAGRGSHPRGPESACGKANPRSMTSARRSEPRLDAAYGGEKSHVWIRDFDPDAAVVWFTYENPTGSGTWQESTRSTPTARVTPRGFPGRGPRQDRLCPRRAVHRVRHERHPRGHAHRGARLPPTSRHRRVDHPSQESMRFHAPNRGGPPGWLEEGLPKPAPTLEAERTPLAASVTRPSPRREESAMPRPPARSSARRSLRPPPRSASPRWRRADCCPTCPSLPGRARRHRLPRGRRDRGRREARPAPEASRGFARPRTRGGGQARLHVGRHRQDRMSKGA